MSDKKGIAYYKDRIIIASFVVVVLGFGAKAVLLSDQVKRNKVTIEKLTEKLEDADLKLLNYRLGKIEENVDKIVTYIFKDE